MRKRTVIDFDEKGEKNPRERKGKGNRHQKKNCHQDFLDRSNRKEKVLKKKKDYRLSSGLSSWVKTQKKGEKKFNQHCLHGW